jgi:hypothetical protein
MIPLLSPDEAQKRFAESGIAEAVGNPNLAGAMSKLNVVRALLQNPSVTAAQSRLAGALMGSKTLQSAASRTGYPAHRMAHQVGVRVLPARRHRTAAPDER